MLHIHRDHDKHEPRRSGGYLFTLKSFVLLVVGAGIILLWVHDPRLGVAVLGGVTALGLLAKLIELRTLACGGYHPPHAARLVDRHQALSCGTYVGRTEDFGQPGRQVAERGGTRPMIVCKTVPSERRELSRQPTLVRQWNTATQARYGHLEQRATHAPGSTV